MAPDTINSAEQKALDAEEAALRNEAQSLDPARPEDATIHDDANPDATRAASREGHDSKSSERTGSAKKPATGEAQPSTSKAETKKTQDTDAGTKPTPTTTDDKDAAAVDESKMTPFQKERRRLDQTWKKVEADKAEIARQRQEIEGEKRALAERSKQPSGPPKSAEGFTAEDYEATAKDFEAEGKMQLAKAARDKAESLRKQATAQPPTGRHERFTAEEVTQMQQTWQKNLETAVKETPELTQETSPLRARVSELLKTTPILHMSGDGILYAVAYAKAEVAAKRVPELEAKNAELEKEIKRLTGLTSLPSGGAQPAATAKKFDELSLADQEAALREEAVTA